VQLNDQFIEQNYRKTNRIDGMLISPPSLYNKCMVVTR